MFWSFSMRQIFAFGVRVFVCLGVLAGPATSFADQRVPVEGVDPVPAPPVVERPTHPVRTGETPVPVGEGSFAQEHNERPRPATTPGAIPVDENAPVEPEAVLCVGAAPIAVEDVYVIEEDGVLTVIVEVGILGNDFDPEGDPLTTILITNGVDDGSLVVFPSGNFTYTPDPGFLGIDQFTYRMWDGTTSADATVSIDVLPSSNRAPVANDEYYRIEKNGSLVVDVATGVLMNDFDPDGDDADVTLITNGVDDGSLTVFPNGNFTYTPNANFVGTDVFVYRIAANGQNSQATCTIEVYDPNRAPFAQVDYYYVPTNGTLSVASPAGILSNDFDPDGDPLTTILITNGVDDGSLTVFPSGNFTYTPDATFSGDDTFTYRMWDGSLNAQATVYITVGSSGRLTDAPPGAGSRAFALRAAQPNPFNPSTQIDFELEGPAQTSLRIYDARGRLVRTLVNQSMVAGEHSVQWDGRDDRGSSVASGSYFLSLTSGTQHAPGKLTLVK